MFLYYCECDFFLDFFFRELAFSVNSLLNLYMHFYWIYVLIQYDFYSFSIVSVCDPTVWKQGQFLLQSGPFWVLGFAWLPW